MASRSPRGQWVNPPTCWVRIPAITAANPYMFPMKPRSSFAVWIHWCSICMRSGNLAQTRMDNDTNLAIVWCLKQSSSWSLLTRWGLTKVAAISQMTFSIQFLESKVWNLIEILLKFCSQESNLQQALAQIMAWPEQVTSHYLNQWWSSRLTHLCVAQPHCLNTMRPQQMMMISISGMTFSIIHSWMKVCSWWSKCH